MEEKCTNRIENISHGFGCILLNNWATVSFSRRSLFLGVYPSWLTPSVVIVASAACHVMSNYSKWCRATPSCLFLAGNSTWCQLITIEISFYYRTFFKCRLFRLCYSVVDNIMQVSFETDKTDKYESTGCPFNTSCASALPWYRKMHLSSPEYFFNLFKLHTDKCTFIVFNKLKFTLKHLKHSNMFDHTIILREHTLLNLQFKTLSDLLRYN